MQNVENVKGVFLVLCIKSLPQEKLKKYKAVNTCFHFSLFSFYFFCSFLFLNFGTRICIAMISVYLCVPRIFFGTSAHSVKFRYCTGHFGTGGHLRYNPLSGDS